MKYKMKVQWELGWQQGQVELGQVVQLQLFVIGEEEAVRFEPVGFAAIFSFPISKWDDFSNLDYICWWTNHCSVGVAGAFYG